MILLAYIFTTNIELTMPNNTNLRKFNCAFRVNIFISDSSHTYSILKCDDKSTFLWVLEQKEKKYVKYKWFRDVRKFLTRNYIIENLQNVCFNLKKLCITRALCIGGVFTKRNFRKQMSSNVLIRWKCSNTCRKITVSCVMNNM